MAGVTNTGFEIKTYETLLAEIEQKQREGIAEDLILDDPAIPNVQVNRVMANELAELWELGRVAALCQDTRTAEGYLQTSTCANTGTLRLPATRSTVSLTCNLDAGFTLPAGSIANVTDKPTIKFRSVADATNPGGSPDDIPVAFESIDKGPIEALSGTLEVITVPVVGWNSVTNADDAEKGKPEETDAELRVRQILDLAAEGGATIPGIYGDLDLAAVAGVLEFTVLENNQDGVQVVEGVELAGHSITLFIWDGDVPEADDAEIAAALFKTTGGGIGTNGDIVEVVTDAGGNEHEVRFFRIEALDVWITIEATYDPKADVIPTEDTVTAAILATGAARQRRGRDVISDKYIGSITAVPGIEKITSYTQAVDDPGASPAPDESTIVVSPLQIARLDSSRISVTLSEASST